MTPRIYWSTLKEVFNGQWIEISEYHWDWSASHPTWAKVTRHAVDRNELVSNQKNASPTHLILYIGPTGIVPPSYTENVVL